MLYVSAGLALASEGVDYIGTVKSFDVWKNQKTNEVIIQVGHKEHQYRALPSDVAAVAMMTNKQWSIAMHLISLHESTI